MNKVQLIHQAKWEMDFETDNQHSQAVRHFFFIMYKSSEKWIFSGGAGTFAEFSNCCFGFMRIRAGAEAAYGLYILKAPHDQFWLLLWFG